jgi:hypothetical protein
VLAGNQTSRLTGQYVNAFSGSSSVAVNFDASTDTTIVQFAGAPIAGNATAFHTFGYAINAVASAPGGTIVNPGNTDGYWTPGVTIPGHVPEQNISARYLTSLSEVVVTISNDPGTFSLSDVGYLVTSVPYALTSLNRTTLPPGAFVPSGVPDGTTLGPGGSTSFTISGVSLGQYVTIFSDAQWTGSSSSNFYQDESGGWLEFQAVPEPASWMLTLVGIVMVLGRVFRLSREPKVAPASTSRSKDLS